MGKVDGRTAEVLRSVGRGVGAVANMEALGELTITVDCDVLQADGGTRTASITGGFIALVDALWSVVQGKTGELVQLVSNRHGVTESHQYHRRTPAL